MTTYRTGGHWGVTIVRESGDCDCPHDDPRGDIRHDINGCGLSDDDQLVAVVVNGDRELAERICELLNAPTPDVPYTCGAREALAEVRRRLEHWDKLNPLHAAQPALATVYGMLRDAAAELGVDEDAPSGRAVTPQSDQDGPGVGRGANDAPKPAEIESERFWVESVEEGPNGARVWVSCDTCKAWCSEVDSPYDLAELVRRAGEHGEVCR